MDNTENTVADNIMVEEICSNTKPCKHRVIIDKENETLTSPEIVKLLYENKKTIPEHFVKKIKVESQGKTRFSLEIDGKIVYSGKGERINKILKQIKSKNIVEVTTVV